MRLLTLIILPIVQVRGNTKFGSDGGAWNECVHVCASGAGCQGATLMTEERYARAVLALAQKVEAKSVLNFGCGLGLMLSIVTRGLADVTDAVCIEPNKMSFWKHMEMLRPQSTPSGFWETWLSSPRVELPRQASVYVAEKDHDECKVISDQVQRKLDIAKKFDIVFSDEVVEHIPKKLHRCVLDFLVAHTGKLLVFGMGVPDSGGHGHIGNRPHAWVIEELTKRGMHLLPNITSSLVQVGLPPWGDNRMVVGHDPMVLKDEPFHALTLQAVPSSWRVIREGVKEWRHKSKNTSVKYAKALKEWKTEKERYGDVSFPKLASFVRRLGLGEVTCHPNTNTLESSI